MIYFLFLVVIVVVLIVGGGRLGKKEGGDEFTDGAVGYSDWVWICVDTNRGEAGDVVLRREAAGDRVGRVLAVVSKNLWKRGNRRNQRR